MRPLILSLMLFASAAQGGEAVVEAATAEPAADGTWRISVTLSHGDTGWEHYADGWSVETEAGADLGFRELLHPHVNEQPFTRSLSGVAVPEGITRVFIRARDSEHGWSSVRFALDLSE